MQLLLLALNKDTTIILMYEASWGFKAYVFVIINLRV